MNNQKSTKMAAEKRTKQQLQATITRLERIISQLNADTSRNQLEIKKAQADINERQAAIERDLQTRLRTEGQVQIMREWLAEAED
jgi:septal ring factor EnvC (AmiA/AmiB activator)